MASCSVGTSFPDGRPWLLGPRELSCPWKTPRVLRRRCGFGSHAGRVRLCSVSPGCVPHPRAASLAASSREARGSGSPCAGPGRPAPVLPALQPSLLAAPAGRDPAPFSQHVRVHVLSPALCDIYRMKGGRLPESPWKVRCSILGAPLPSQGVESVFSSWVGRRMFCFA